MRRIADLVPHQGSMCLLDDVLEWDERIIVCRASSHRRPDHPLRERWGLYAHCGIEYGAQAAAAHAALVDGPHRPARRGLLAAIRDLITHVPRLDTVEGLLTIRAELLLVHDGGGRVYGITLSGGFQTLVTARISVVTVEAADLSLVGGTAS
ncbi:MAG TPA: hypothetical protein VFQ34_14830 [Nitrospiraceae bacterium]|nr:hypothetical protein [Nitrospiraceae bacterium]